MSDFYEDARECMNWAIIKLGLSGKVEEYNRHRITRYIQRKMQAIYERARREENEACATIAHNEAVEGGSGKTEVVFYKIRARLEEK